jgi:predicted DNA-binding transcriptional regulator AlpA
MTILRLLGSNFLWIVLPNWPSGANRKSKKLSATSKKLLDKTRWSVARLAKGAQARFATSNQRNPKEMGVTVVMNERYLTEVQVSERTCISLATLRRWRLENRGPKFRKFGSLVRYDEEELNRWEEAQPSGGDDPDQRIKPRSVRGSALLRRTG